MATDSTPPDIHLAAMVRQLANSVLAVAQSRTNEADAIRSGYREVALEVSAVARETAALRAAVSALHERLGISTELQTERSLIVERKVDAVREEVTGRHRHVDDSGKHRSPGWMVGIRSVLGEIRSVIGALNESSVSTKIVLVVLALIFAGLTHLPRLITYLAH